MADVFDVVVAGGGLSGVLTAARLNHAKESSINICLVEKENCLGGRLRTTSNEDRRYSYGLSGISENLYNYWDQTLKNDPSASDLGEFSVKEQKSFGMLGGGKLTSAPVTDLDDKLGVRALGGLAAFREWPKFLKELNRVVSGEIKERTIGELYKGGRKSPVAIVLTQLGGWFGMPDVFHSSCSAFYQAMEQYKSVMKIGDWESALLETLGVTENLELRVSTHIVNAKRIDDLWVLMTDKGVIKSRKIIVAQSPWEALKWLPKEYWPSELLSICLKTKPASLVSLSTVLSSSIDIPDTLIVPSESCQAMVDGSKITFQIAIDFEMSLSAPNVVKAVKKLKRAKRKLLGSFEGVTADGDFIALVPGGWCVSSALSQKKSLAKYSKMAKFNQEELSFCGETYGVSDLGDENILTSIQGVLSLYGQSLEENICLKGATVKSSGIEEVSHELDENLSEVPTESNVSEVENI